LEFFDVPVRCGQAVVLAGAVGLQGELVDTQVFGIFLLRELKGISTGLGCVEINPQEGPLALGSL